MREIERRFDVCVTTVEYVAYSYSHLHTNIQSVPLIVLLPCWKQSYY